MSATETTWQRVTRYLGNCSDALDRKDLTDAEHWQHSAGYVLSITKTSPTHKKYTERHRELNKRIVSELWEALQP